jgi:hypothetical protein
MIDTEDFECPSCGGWATFKRGRLVERDCDPDCEVLAGDLQRAFENDQQYRAEKAFEDSLSGDFGPLSLQDQAIDARRLK